MALFVLAGVVLWALAMVFFAPRLIPSVSRRQIALILVTLILLWIPMGSYIFLVVVPSSNVNSKEVGRIGALNLLIIVPLFIFIAKKWILKKDSKG